MDDGSGDSPRIFAQKGETITCIQNHPICEIARDIYVGEPRGADDFTNWQQPQPDKETSVAEIRCAMCRGIWVRGNTANGYQFHFSNGWR